MNFLTKIEIEQKLDDCIQYSLGALLQYYPASDEFMEIFQQEKIFIKPNTKAFIHIAHYLFNILDSKEFKKRFYWPIQCKADESHFRTATVEYINHLISKGQLKNEKIAATYVVLPGGVKFMKLLIKIIKMVLVEVKMREKSTEFEMKKPLEVYMEEIAEKNECLKLIAVEIKQTIVSSIHDIKKKLEKMDNIFMSAFYETDVHDHMSAIEFLHTWSQKNAKRFSEIKKQQKALHQCICDFDRMNKRAMKMLEPIDFSTPNYDTEITKTAISALKDPSCIQMDELNFPEPVNGRASSLEMFYIISSNIESVIDIMAQIPVREIEDIQDDAVVVHDLYIKTMKAYDEVFSLQKMFLDRPNLSYASPHNILRENSLLNVYVSTPPIGLTVKFSENTVSPFELPFQRPGEPIRFNLSQSILQMSQRQLQFTPKPNRSISMNALNDLRPPAGKRQPLINSAALFAMMSKKDLKNSSICSRLDSYSIVMPGSENVLSSTVLESTRRSLTPLMDFDIKVSTGSIESATLKAMSGNSSDLNQTQIPNFQKQNTPSQTPKRVSFISQRSLIAHSPDIQIKINDQVHVSLFEVPNIPDNSHIDNSQSPTGRVLRPITRSIQENGSIVNPNNLSLKLEEENKEEDDPSTVDLLQKFSKIKLCNKENLFDTSYPGFLNDSF